MTYHEAEQQILSGEKSARERWGKCKHIRSARESDEEFINYPHNGLIVLDCARAECDCRISIFRASGEDMLATDWIIL